MIRSPSVVLSVIVTMALVGCGGSSSPVDPVSSIPPRHTPVSAVVEPPVAAPPVISPPVTSPPVTTPSDADPPVVVLDPGHNGGNGANPEMITRQVPDGRGGMKDCNTTGTATDTGYPEHAFNWDVAGRVSQRLTAAGIEVVLTRPDDEGVGPCVDERGQAGERADADAVVSIHADGSDTADSGYHIALSDPPVNAVQDVPARRLATEMRDAMRAAGFPDSDYLGREGLSPRDDLAGLNHATRPTVLVECANMRNPVEAVMVSSTDGRERYAAAITEGILAFLEPSDS